MVNSPAILPRKLEINPRTCLLDAGTIRAALGCDAQEVLNKVESGQYLWVFNISPRNSIQQLRFFADEVADPRATRQLSLDHVIGQILPPTRTRFRSGEICQKFLICRPTLHRIRRKLGLKVGEYGREALAQFLRAGWIGEHGQQDLGSVVNGTRHDARRPLSATLTLLGGGAIARIKPQGH